MTATTQDIRPEEPRPLFRIGGCGLASLALVVTGMVSGVSAEDYTVNGKITLGTCEVSFPTVTTGSLSLPPVSRSVMNDGSIQSMEGVPVQLSHCVGLNAAGKAPTLSITGTTVTDLPAGTGKYLFNNNEPGAARGYGIVLSTEKLSKWTPSSQVSGDGSATSDVVLAPASLPYTGGTKDFYVGVGCGDAITCTAQDGGHAGGDITAGITFTFDYR